MNVETLIWFIFFLLIYKQSLSKNNKSGPIDYLIYIYIEFL